MQNLEKENSCKQSGKEVLRDYSTDISTTDFEEPLHLSFSLSPEQFGAGSFKEEMLAGRFSTKSQIFQAILPLLQVARES